MTEPHCITRARERYGIELSWQDLRQIEARCEAREGLTAKKPDGTRFHCITFDKHVLWVVFEPAAVSWRGVGRVVTIMPPNVADALRSSDAENMRKRTKNYKLRKRAWR
jgi:hypothetical protein